MNEQEPAGPRREPFEVMVIGGSGTFGSGVVEALAATAGVRVAIAGRDLGRARRQGERLSRDGGAGAIRAISLNAQDPNLAALLGERRCDLVIHAAGPFQGQSYHVARCCIEAGCHYVDLADGRAFVVGITALDAAARERGVRVISGASSVPGLSSAAVVHLAGEFASLEAIEMAISPGNRAPRGEATVAAIMGYAGRPFLRWEAGVWATAYGWQDLKHLDFGDPGRRWLASCDVADLELFPRHFSPVRTVTFHAGLELASLHFALWAMSWLARSRLVANWARYAAPITRLARRFERFGTDRGGMLVRVSGTNRQGSRLVRTWRLTAGSGHGPRIPALPAVVLAKKLARGELSDGGAGPCVGLFSLDEFSREAASLDISQRIT